MYFKCCIKFLFVKWKTEYEVRISDWSSDVCSSDLIQRLAVERGREQVAVRAQVFGDRVEAGVAVGDEREPVVAGKRGAQRLRLRRERGRIGAGQIGRASCRERVGEYV